MSEGFKATGSISVLMENPLYAKLLSLQKELTENQKTIESLKERNASIISDLRESERVIRQDTIHAKEQDKEKAIVLGERCFICGKPSTVACFWCQQLNTPSGYCENHRDNAHKKEHPDHIALYRRVYHARAIVLSHKLTEEEQIEVLEKKLAQLKAQNAKRAEA